MKDKLIELIKSRRDPCDIGACPFTVDDVRPCSLCEAESLADHLIANGVTFSDVPEINVGNKGLVDLAVINQTIKPKADSTLKAMKKADLIDYIRCLENNYNTAVWFNENQARYVESLDLPKWIPVSEGKPKLIPCSAGTAYSNAVNALTSGRKVITAIWDGEDFIGDAAFWDAEDEEITHWSPVLLPLPDLPKEDE